MNSRAVFIKQSRIDNRITFTFEVKVYNPNGTFGQVLKYKEFECKKCYSEQEAYSWAKKQIAEINARLKNVVFLDRFLRQ